MRKLNRREFLMASALAAGGRLIFPYRGSGIAWGIDSPEVSTFPTGTKGMIIDIIDPIPGELFRAPPEMPITRNGSILSCIIEPKPAQVNVNGIDVRLLTYNGTYPAATIRVKNGDILRIKFRNSLPHNLGENMLGHDRSVTNIHTHGWHISPANNGDNVLLHHLSGEEFHYEYDLSKQPAGTLGYYHPHVHGGVADQVWYGLSGGALVVEDETPDFSKYETHILIITDMTLKGIEPEPYMFGDWQRGKYGKMVMINGQVNPVLSVKPGQVVRLRIVNACTARFANLSMEGHQMHLIGCDGGLLDRPYPLNNLLVSVGERVDLLIKVDKKPGKYRLLSLPYGHTLQKVTLMTLSCEGSTSTDELPSIIHSGVADEAKRLIKLGSNSLKRTELTFSFKDGRGTINNRVFGEDEPCVIISEVGTHEIWTIKSASAMDHPFHQHINGAVVLDIQGGDPDYASLYSTIPAIKDTVNIPPFGSVTMLVPVEHYTGDTVFHCHILEHEDIGMLGIWKLI